MSTSNISFTQGKYLLLLQNWFETDQMLFLTTQLCASGNLDDCKNLISSEDDIRVIASQCLSALNFLHVRGMVHDDISPQVGFVIPNQINPKLE